MEGHEEVSLLKNTGQQTTSRQSTFLNKLKKLPVIEGWVTYMHQEAVLAGLALAVLYFTVLRYVSRCISEVKVFKFKAVALSVFSRGFCLRHILK